MSMQIALSALQSINTQLDNISQNIANTGTTGYKSSRTNFSAMYANSAPNGVQAGSTTQTLDVNGGLLSTGRNLDVAVSGKGYFMVKDATGVTNYTRTGVFDIDASGNLVDHLGREVQGYDANQKLTSLNVPTGQIPAEASTKLSYVGNLSADWLAKDPAKPFSMTDASTYNSSTVSVVYDSLGSEHTITQYFRKTADQSVDVFYSIDGQLHTAADASGVQQPVSKSMVFSNAGQLTDPAITLDFTPKGGAQAMSVGLSYEGTTQFAGDTATTTNSANGYASGTMVNVSIGSDGAVNVQYSNGMIQSVGALALASFRSEGGLKAVDGTSWQASAQSGVALIGKPGSAQFGELVGQQLEQSNVDVATELVDLMGAQRNYQANTKVISTQSEIMQSLMQVI